jgi:type III secretory pathway component EscT
VGRNWASFLVITSDFALFRPVGMLGILCIWFWGVLDGLLRNFAIFAFFLGIFSNFSFLWHFRPFGAILLCFGGILGNFVVLPFFSVFSHFFALFRLFWDFRAFKANFLVYIGNM